MFSSERGARRVISAVAGTCAAALIALGAATPAAASSQERDSKIPGTSATLTTKGWLDTFASGGCSDWTSSATVTGGSAPRAGKDWVKTYIKFDGWGIGNNLTSLGETGDAVDHTWTNENGARGAYMSGNLCTGWNTLGVDIGTNGSTFYYGVTHSVSTS
jgi:hypothetical protein